MPVQVHVPLTLRLPAPRLAAADLADLEVATGDALGRAFDVVRERVLVPRGRNRVVEVADPEVRFADGVDQTIHPEIEAAVGRAVEHALDVSELRSWYRPAEPVAAVLYPPVERFDPSRLHDGTYSIPMYDDGTPGDVPVEEEPEPFTFTYGNALGKAWEAHLSRNGRVWNPAVYGYPGYYGRFIMDGKLVTRSLIYFSHVAAIGEDGWPTSWEWHKGTFWMVQYAEESDRLGRTALDASLDHWVLTRTETPGTLENVTQLVEDMAKDMPDFPFDAEVRARMAAEVADPQGLIFTLSDGSRRNFIVLQPGTVETGGIAHSPIRFVVEGSDLATGEEGGGGGGTEGAGEAGDAGDGGHGGDGGDGGDGGREGGSSRGQARKRGGPLGRGAEGEGSVWPSVGIGGEAFVCEPFLGEPPVTDLVVGGEVLEADMRDLAIMLDVEFCGYAGQFCLNAVRLVGSRAHDLGITSITSTIRTAVTARPDGGGNHGFVDLQPGQSPELQYMEALGDIAVRLNNLANDITRTYQAKENRHLVYWDSDKDYDPDAVAWSLRFYIELADDLVNSCTWLYAETCRIILLQQLRSSHQGIVGRQDRFPETRERFDEVLGILGESVVKLSVLKRAIAHAERHGLRGSVRSVLSFKPPPRRYGKERELVEFPAPIESIASQIVTLLETATIETHVDESVVARFDGRLWDKDDLDQGIGLRRAILNQVDPLFLQVPDLDRLYMQFRRTPGSSETYLRELLASMRKANEDMTSEASNWGDGAFFALEASQWVEAKGGLSSTGQRYELQGIHKLADNVLRPWTGSLDAYRRGVDRAIGIKANWDKFVNAFAIVGIIALALLCAPLGVIAVGVVTGVAGLVLTARDIAEADRLEALYRSLEDPEAILAWQDVQLARLMADLSIAFSIFDVIGVGKGARAIVAGARVALKEVAEQGIRATARVTLRSARRTILLNMGEEVLQNAVRQATTQLAIAITLQAVLPTVITPVLVPWIRGVALEHGNLPGIDAALGPLLQGQPAVPIGIPGALPPGDFPVGEPGEAEGVPT